LSQFVDQIRATHAGHDDIRHYDVDFAGVLVGNG
jgi:hypothetical protein